MPVERWQSLALYDKSNHPVTGLWLHVVELLPRNRIVRIAATGRWPDQIRTGPCGPEGLLDFSLNPDQLILPDSPPGALVAKVGGSTAHKKDGTLFALGTFAVIGALEKPAPLFVAVNGAWNLPQFQYTQIKLEIATTEP
jgi:hypothetical protein